MNDRKLIARLRELREDPPPPSLAARLEAAVPARSTEPSAWRPPRVVRWAAVAAVVIAAAALLPRFQGRRPGLVELLAPVAHATGSADAVHVVLSARTRVGEDFAFVQVDGPMQRTDAWLENPHHQPFGRARIEKGDRLYVWDGRQTTRYLRRRNEALRFDGQSVETEAFWPAAWVQLVVQAAPSSVQVLAHEEEGDTTRVLVFEKATSASRSSWPMACAGSAWSRLRTRSRG